MEIGALEDKVSKLKPLLILGGEGVAELEEKLKEDCSKAKVIEYKISRLKKESDNISGLDAKCPTCLQDISESHKKSIIKKNELEAGALSVKLKELLAGIKSLENKISIAKKNEALLKELDSISLAIELLRGQKDSYGEELSNMPRESFGLSEKIFRLSLIKKRFMKSSLYYCQKNPLLKAQALN
jgi:hypothetical protein